MLRAKITKDDVNLLPVIQFGGRVTVIDDLSNVKSAIDELRRYSVVGIDTETKPSFTRGTHHMVSLVQISTLDHCFLFRLNMIDLPSELINFLSERRITKIGLSLRDDLVGLNKRQTFRPEGFVDIQTIAKYYGILELSLQKIYAILFERKISKAQRLTNWENTELTEQQQRYAATDAWASLQIYIQLMTEKKLSKIQIDKIVKENTLTQKNQPPKSPDGELQNEVMEDLTLL